jgi:hypothetical protein
MHRGRIWCDPDDGWWRYACCDCDYGAGSLPDGFASRIVHRWLIKLATEHTQAGHWSRRDRG